MFSIHLSLRRNGDDLTGLKALDMRRRLKLQDGSSLHTAYGAGHWREAAIPEHIARAYFTSEQVQDYVEIPLALLTPEDVAEQGTGVVLRKDLSQEHLIELYITYRMWKVRKHSGQALL